MMSELAARDTAKLRVCRAESTILSILNPFIVFYFWSSRAFLISNVASIITKRIYIYLNTIQVPLY